jgi:hypothetical protein
VARDPRDHDPEDFRLADGAALDIHTVMDHLLKASEGDMRIMGVTSVVTQRMRNAMRKRRATSRRTGWAR